MMADRFDEAFRPATLTDDQIERLARLVGSVIRMNLHFETGDMLIDGEVYAVGKTTGCEFCGTWGPHDCIHQRALALAIRAEEQAREDDRQDLYETYNTALGVGVQ